MTTAAKQLDWHFPRPALAKIYLDAFAAGLLSAQALFAKRRMGKTTFLQRDLWPAATRRRWRVAYANLWQQRAAPLAVILDALEHVALPLPSRVAAMARSRVSKVKLSASIVKGELAGEVEAARKDTPAVSHRALATLLDRVATKKSPLLLLLDEAQVLAEPAHVDAAAAMRSLLDVRKDAVKVIFTGSSETALRRMFGRERHPLYHWAPINHFPLLGREYVEHQIKVFSRISKHRLGITDALRIFASLHEVPEHFREFLDTLLRSATGDLDQAVADTRRAIGDEGHYAQRWNALLPADREVLRLIAVGAHDELHSEAVRKSLARSLGIQKAVPLMTVANSLRRLVTEQVVVRTARGEYAFEDSMFREWITSSE